VHAPYLAETVGEVVSIEIKQPLVSSRLTLSNPMDLTTAARILVGGERPTLASFRSNSSGR
jgi:hypothetical protein